MLEFPEITPRGQMLEIAKLGASVIGGGLAGAILNAWLHNRRSRVQYIPLIERANRLASPELQGIILARVIATTPTRQIEELRNLREYQLTMRNQFHTPAGR